MAPHTEPILISACTPIQAVMHVARHGHYRLDRCAGADQYRLGVWGHPLHRDYAAVYQLWWLLAGGDHGRGGAALEYLALPSHAPAQDPGAGRGCWAPPASTTALARSISPGARGGRRRA